MCSSSTIRVFYQCSRWFPSSFDSSHCSTWPCLCLSWCKSPHSPELLCYLAPSTPNSEPPWAPSHGFLSRPSLGPLCRCLSSNILGWTAAYCSGSRSPPRSGWAPSLWSAEGTTCGPRAILDSEWCCSCRSMPVLLPRRSGLRLVSHAGRQSRTGEARKIAVWFL